MQEDLTRRPLDPEARSTVQRGSFRSHRALLWGTAAAAVLVLVLILW